MKNSVETVNDFKPGSKEAISRGCTCPIMDNHFGAGISSDAGDVFYYIDSDCIVHKNYWNRKERL